MSRTPVSDWQQLSALYEQADVLDPATLSEWLGALRERAHPLLPQLEQMLIARSEVRSNGFLGTLPRLSTHPSERPTDWHDGSRIGPYRLLRSIGTGGMAEVWLAQRDDGAFQRQVAIKLLFRHAGSSERDTFAQRFDRERDILASLNHPNIAGLHDAGVAPGGQPWLALEYVEGEMLTRWCDARCLTIADRVRLFRQVLNAVQHAHANLVIHRDIKPGNILVTEQGEVRLLDFGIAKLMEPEGGALAETELTRLAGRPMTPQYASPEQLMGQPLTTASDVYSLGVVLYELLCGERPYELKVESPAQLEHAILDLDPRAPSRRAITNAVAAARGSTGVELRRQLGSDLDAIVLKALAKQPAQRYGSVESLGLDLDRWLEGKTVEARAPSTLYRAGKFVRRHTVAVSLSGMAVVALILVATAAVVMSVRAREDSARAIAARDFMLGLFKLADTEKSHGADITAKEMLETGRKGVLVKLANQPQLQIELLAGIAGIQGDMGEFAAADATYVELDKAYSKVPDGPARTLAQIDRGINALGMSDVLGARRLAEQIDSRNPERFGNPEIDASLAQLRGLLSLIATDSSRAVEILAPARDAAMQRLGARNKRTFRLGQALVQSQRDAGQIAAALSLQEELRRNAREIDVIGEDELAKMDWDQVNLLTSAGRYRDALELSAVVLPHCVNVLGPQAQPCRFLLIKHNQLLVKLGRLDELNVSLERIDAIAGDENVPFLEIEALLLELRLASKDPESVEAQRLVARVQRFAQGDPLSPKQATLRSGAMLGLAEARLREGRWHEAEELVAAAMRVIGDDGRQAARTRTGANARNLMGVVALEQGKAAEAAQWIQRAIDYYAATAGDDHPTTQALKVNFALSQARLGELATATAMIDHARGMLEAVMGATSPTCLRLAELSSLLRMEAADDARSGLPNREGSAFVSKEFLSG